MQTAVNEAPDNAKITLVKSVEVNHAVTIPAGVTLDSGKNTTITLTSELANGAFITAGGDNVTIRNITINTNGNAKHGVQFYCVKGGEMDKVTVNGGYYTSVIVNGAEATIKNSILNLDEGQGYTNIEFAVGSGVTTVPKVTIENVTVTPNRPVVYMDKTTFDRIQALSGTSGITRDELNEQYVKGAFLYYNKDGSITPNPDTLPTITFDPTEGSIADSAKEQKINISGHLDSLPTASRSDIDWMVGIQRPRVVKKSQQTHFSLKIPPFMLSGLKNLPPALVTTATSPSSTLKMVKFLSATHGQTKTIRSH